MKKCGCPKKPNRVEVEHTKECIIDLIKNTKISITPEMKQRFLDNLKARNKKVIK